MHLVPEQLNEDCLVAKGNDSHVYRIGEKAIKLYQRLDCHLLEFYLQALTNANQFIRSYTPQRPITVFSTNFRIRFEAVDVEAKGTVHNRTYTVSRYSPYPNLDVLTWPRPNFEKYLRLSSLDDSRADVQFLLQLNNQFLEERPTRVFDEFVYIVDLLSRALDIHLGHHGHYIGKYNTKIIPHLNDAELVLEITDTAVYIDRMSL